MAESFSEIAFTASVRAAQHRYAGHEQQGGGVRAQRGELGAREAEFIAARDSFYMATVSETGWPYVQHRGGPAGFLRVVGPNTLAFGDFGGNRQFVSVGNLSYDDRVSLILVDYPARRRLKIFGRARVAASGEAPAELLARVVPAAPGRPVERVVLIEVEAFDWNCAQHITPRYTEHEWRSRLERATTTRSEE